MRNHRSAAGIVMAGLLLIAPDWTGAAADEAAAVPQKTADAKERVGKPDEKAAGKQRVEVPVFVPPNTGAPITRVGGATRGVGLEPLPSIRALVPKQVAYTLEAQPVVYWRLSEATDRRVDFTLIENEASTPLLETTLEGPFEAGDRPLALADHGVSLEPGVTYMWYVSLVVDPERRSDDRVAGGAIQRISPTSELLAGLERAGDERRANALAGAGVWYDTVHALAARAETSPEARAQLSGLLEQVGLSVASTP